jgi:predicted transcriptional regulator
MIKDALGALGFTDKEQQVYLAILKNSRITPARLAQQVGLNRTTVYSVAQSLSQKGLISEDATAATLTYLASSPDELSNLIEHDRHQLKKREALVDEVVGELDRLDVSQGLAAPKIKFIRESEIDRYLHAQTKTWDDSLVKYDGIWWGFQTATFVEAYADWIRWYWPLAKPKGISLQLITNNVAAEQAVAAEKFEGRRMKFWENGTIKETTWILGDYLVMIATEQHPHYLVEIKNAALCATMREMFKLIWSAVPDSDRPKLGQ